MRPALRRSFALSARPFRSPFRFALSVRPFGSLFRFALSVRPFGSPFRFALSVRPSIRLLHELVTEVLCSAWIVANGALVTRVLAVPLT